MIHMFYWYGFVRSYAQIYYESGHDATLRSSLDSGQWHTALPQVLASATTSTTAMPTPTQTQSPTQNITYYI